MYDFSELKSYMDTFEKIGIPMADMKVMIGHEEVFHYGVGYSDADLRRKTCGDDILWIFSATKVITCTGAMRLIDRGELSPDDTLDKYLPEFAEMTVQTKDGGKTVAERKITVRDLFTMSAGFSYTPLHQVRKVYLAKHKGIGDLNELKDQVPEPLYELGLRDRITTREFARAVSLLPLSFEPSTHFCYSICHDILGVVIEVISGMSLSEYMKKYIFDPLGMNDTGFVLTDEQEKRLAVGYEYKNVTNTASLCFQDCNFNIAPGFESGGAGLHSTVNDYIKLVDTLACGGTAENGYFLMKPESVALMAENRLTQSALADFCSPARFFGYGWGYCGRAHIRPDVSLALSPAGEFGWDGAACSYCLVDIKNKLSIFFGTYMQGEKEYMYSTVHPHLRDFVYKAITKK